MLTGGSSLRIFCGQTRRTTAIHELLRGCCAGWTDRMWRICQRDAGEHKASMVRGQLRVAVIGAQTEAADSPKAYTVYRTSVNYRGVCYHRLLRFSEFLRFSRKVTIEDGEPITAPFPRKLWTRKASLRSDVVEARQVLLNEYMQQICSLELSPRTEDHLLRLLQLGQHDRGSTATVISRGRLSKLSTATSLADPATVDEEARESAEVCSPIEEASDVPLSASTLEIRVAPMVDPIPDESNEQASGEFAAESGNGTDTDWLRSSLEGRGQRAGSLSGMPLTPIKRPLMRASDSLPPKKVVDFALTPENDEDNGPVFVFADSGASSTTSSPSPTHKYERAVLAQRARVSELLSGKLRIETA